MNITFRRDLANADALIVMTCEHCITDDNTPCGKPATYILHAVPHAPSVCLECFQQIRRFDNPLKEEPIQ